MTQGPDDPTPQEPSDDETQPYGQRPYGQEPPSPPPAPQSPYGQQPPPSPPPAPQSPYGQQPPPPAYGTYPGVPYGASPAAPYGVHPVTGIPYSEKSKIVAGILQIVLPLGIGRFYIGDTGLGVAQLLVTIFTCGIGGLWPMIDGIIILASDSKDSEGRMLRS